MNKKTGNDLFIVDNSDEDWKVLNYLKEWADISSRFDIATGYFEIVSCWRSMANGRSSNRSASSWATRSPSVPSAR